jgi:hypothetical protein
MFKKTSLILFVLINTSNLGAVTNQDRAKFLAAGLLFAGACMYRCGLQSFSPNIKHCGRALIFAGAGLGFYGFYHQIDFRKIANQIYNLPSKIA